MHPRSHVLTKFLTPLLHRQLIATVQEENIIRIHVKYTVIEGSQIYGACVVIVMVVMVVLMVIMVIAVTMVIAVIMVIVVINRNHSITTDTITVMI
jgi:hypothetical protein